MFGLSADSPAMVKDQRDFTGSMYS